MIVGQGRSELPRLEELKVLDGVKRGLNWWRDELGVVGTHDLEGLIRLTFLDQLPQPYSLYRWIAYSA